MARCKHSASVASFIRSLLATMEIMAERIVGCGILPVLLGLGELCEDRERKTQCVEVRLGRNYIGLCHTTFPELRWRFYASLDPESRRSRISRQAWSTSCDSGSSLSYSRWERFVHACNPGPFVFFPAFVTILFSLLSLCSLPSFCVFIYNFRRPPG